MPRCVIYAAFCLTIPVEVNLMTYQKPDLTSAQKNSLNKLLELGLPQFWAHNLAAASEDFRSLRLLSDDTLAEQLYVGMFVAQNPLIRAYHRDVVEHLPVNYKPPSDLAALFGGPDATDYPRADWTLDDNPLAPHNGLEHLGDTSHDRKSKSIGRGQYAIQILPLFPQEYQEVERLKENPELRQQPLGVFNWSQGLSPRGRVFRVRHDGLGPVKGYETWETHDNGPYIDRWGRKWNQELFQPHKVKEHRKNRILRLREASKDHPIPEDIYVEDHYFMPEEYFERTGYTTEEVAEFLRHYPVLEATYLYRKMPREWHHPASRSVKSDDFSWSDLAGLFD